MHRGNPPQDSLQNSPCTLLRFCGPGSYMRHVGAPEIIENFLEIFFWMFGLPRGEREGEWRIFGTLVECRSKVFDSLRSISGIKFWKILKKICGNQSGK